MIAQGERKHGDVFAGKPESGKLRRKAVEYEIVYPGGEPEP